MRKTSLGLALVSSLFVLATMAVQSQVRAQAVSLQCTMNGGGQLWAGTYNILIEADLSTVTVAFPNGATVYFKPSKGKYQGGVGCWCTDNVDATSAMYDFGYSCDPPYQDTYRQFKIDRISGGITHDEGGRQFYKGTCTKTELHRQF